LSKYSDGKKLFPKIKGFQLKELPIKIADKQTQQPFIDKADLVLQQNKGLQEFSNKFQKYLQVTLQIKKLTKKLQNWHTLEFGEFIKEVNKAIKLTNKANLKLADGEGVNTVYIPTLTKKDEFEWLDLFEENKQKALDLKSKIDATDKEIDQMVYELYGLTEEEIEIVENS
jgi:hypothetical protein